MSIESSKNPEQGKEAVFQSWLTELHGRVNLNRDAIPDDVYEVLQEYMFLDANHMMRARVDEAATKFKNLTGYSIQDFLKYKSEQDEKAYEEWSKT